MPHIQGRIDPDRGPMCQVIISINSVTARTLRAQGKIVPPSVTLESLLDSGAECTMIDISRLPFLDPKDAKLVSVRGLLGQPQWQAQYLVSLTITHSSTNRKADLTRPAIPIVELDPTTGYEAIIGRDLLNDCLFLCDGPNKSYLLGW